MACNSRTMGNHRSSPTLTSRSPLDLDAFSLAPTDLVRLNHSYCTLQFHKIVSFSTVPFGFLDSISLVKVFSRKKNRSKNSPEFSISVFVNLSEKGSFISCVLNFKWSNDNKRRWLIMFLAIVVRTIFFFMAWVSVTRGIAHVIQGRPLC